MDRQIGPPGVAADGAVDDLRCLTSGAGEVQADHLERRAHAIVLGPQEVRVAGGVAAHALERDVLLPVARHHRPRCTPSPGATCELSDTDIGAEQAFDTGVAEIDGSPCQEKVAVGCGANSMRWSRPIPVALARSAALGNPIGELLPHRWQPVQASP
jgi:hypothetical protein